MNDQSMFGELAIRIASHPENVATEALQFILATHPTAWPALRAFLQPATPNLPTRLTFRTQKGSEDEGIPDLVGADHDGKEVLIVEAKFWAALTENQPVAYLRRLANVRDGVLLVLAPAARVPSLWQELVLRCRAAGLALNQLGSSSPEFSLASASSGHILALASWRGLLSFIARDADARGATALAGDLAQLNGLCSRMDTEGFLPLRASELAPEIGRRVLQFAELVDFIVLEELVANRGASRKDPLTGKGLQTGGGGRDMYGRFFAMGGLGCFFCYSPSLWAKHGRPMWLSVQEADWSPTDRLRDLLHQYGLAHDAPVADTPSGPAVPVELPIAVEHANVVKSVADQIESVLETCQPHRAA